MSKRPSVALAVRRNMEEADAAPPAGLPVLPDAPLATALPEPAKAAEPAEKSVASTRMGKKFITFPVSEATKRQFDIMAIEIGIVREELMREALRDLFAKHGKAAID